MVLEQILKALVSKEMVMVLFFPGITFITALSMFSLWFERKLVARVALRLGPVHVGKIGGILQVIGDGVKLISKEIIIPSTANRLGFILMPIIASIFPLLIYPFIPFGGGWVIYPSEIGLLLIFAVVALSPIPLLLAAWVSGTKYPFIGLLRLAFQLFAYEVPMFLALASVVVLAGSFNLERIVEAQARVPFIFLLPLSFLVFFISVLAESERIPFDIPTAEQEIVSGWMAEYSSIFFELLMLASYLKLNGLALLTTALFLGGWMGPPIPFMPREIYEPMWMILKTMGLLFFILLFRGVYPRITMDRLLDLGWRVLIPLALINLFFAVLLAPVI